MLQQLPGGNGHLSDNIRLDQIVYLGSHNSMMAKCYGWMYCQQNASIKEQFIKYGARCFKIPVHWYKDDGEPYMAVAHEPDGKSNCSKTKLQRILKKPQPFAEFLTEFSNLVYTYEKEITIFKIESYLYDHYSQQNGTLGYTKDIVYDKLDQIFKQYGLYQKAIVWQQIAPTLGEVRSQNKNLIILLDQWHLAVDTPLNTYCHFTFHKLGMVNWELDPLLDVQEDKVKRGQMTNFLEIHFHPQISLRFYIFNTQNGFHIQKQIQLI